MVCYTYLQVRTKRALSSVLKSNFLFYHPHCPKWQFNPNQISQDSITTGGCFMIKHRRIHQKNKKFTGKFKEKGEFFIFFSFQSSSYNAFSFDVITVKTIKFVLPLVRVLGSSVVEPLFCTPEVPGSSLSCAKKFFCHFSWTQVQIHPEDELFSTQQHTLFEYIQKFLI